MKNVQVIIRDSWSDTVTISANNSPLPKWMDGNNAPSKVINDVPLVCKSLSRVMTLDQARKEGYKIPFLGQDGGVGSLHCIKHDAYSPMKRKNWAHDEPCVFWGDRVEIKVEKYELKDGYTMQDVEKEAEIVFATQRSGSYSNAHFFNRID